MYNDDDEATKPLTGGLSGSDQSPSGGVVKPKTLETVGNGRHHILSITPVVEERESDVESDVDREAVVYKPTTMSIEGGGGGGPTKMAPVDLESGNGKPKAYIFPMQKQQQHQPLPAAPSSTAGSSTTGASTETCSEGGHSATPSDSRSMCDTPDPDPWTIPELKTATGPAWKDLSTTGKLRQVGLVLGKAASLLALLYFFICSLDLLSTAFRLLGSRAVGRFFSDNELLQNPVVGLMIGVLVTVLVQSSSTSTSIVVTMVASKIIHVRQAIPIVMGANIGTSVTNTIVSLMQSADRNEFRRAFAAATVHDMFNWLTVLVLLPTEVFTRYLETTTTWIVKGDDGSGAGIQQDKTANRDFLNKLTKPFTKMVIKIDKALLEKLASGTETSSATGNATDQSVGVPNDARLLVMCCNDEDVCKENCTDSFFGMLAFSDTTTGVILLAVSILVLCSCLIFLVKVLNSMLTGHIAKLIKRTMNRNYDFPYSIIADYTAIAVGCAMTILVQSSSIFTSALTPLAGIGVISLERIYPLTLGSNIGTTTTGILAALAADSSRIQDTLQLALCHLLFNISGILLFYPVPAMRWPIPLARLLGDITARYRWFSILYLLSMFFCLPLLVFSLSTLGTVAMVVVGGPIAGVLGLVVLINLVQHYHSGWLPGWARNWHFLPLWMRSLEPLDRLITKATQKFGCASCCGTEEVLGLGMVSSSQNQLTVHGLEENEGGKDGGKMGGAANGVHPKLTDAEAVSQLNILGAALTRCNSESQFQNLIYNQGRISMLFHGFGNHHTIHGVYAPHRHHVHTCGRSGGGSSNNHGRGRTNRIKSMAPQYNRAYSGSAAGGGGNHYGSATNNNNNDKSDAGLLENGGGGPRSPNSADSDPESPTNAYFAHHTVHNPYEVHRYYPASPFNSPFGSPTRANGFGGKLSSRPPLQVIVSQPSTPPEPNEEEEEEEKIQVVVMEELQKKGGSSSENLKSGDSKGKNDGEDDDDDSQPKLETNL